MRRATFVSLVLFMFSVLVVSSGCGGSKSDTGMIPPPSKEVKTKDGKTKMVIDKLD